MSRLPSSPLRLPRDRRVADGFAAPRPALLRDGPREYTASRQAFRGDSARSHAGWPRSASEEQKEWTVSDPASPNVTLEPATHRQLGVDLYNSTWTLLEKTDRTD